MDITKMTAAQRAEINRHISEALEQWANIMLMADADQWAYHLDYSECDLFNALYIFNHVAENIGIKNGTISTPDKAAELGTQLKEIVKLMTGLDSAHLAESVCANG